LFSRTGLKPVADCPRPTTALGDWYANLIYLGTAQKLLFVSKASLLAIITPARNARELRERLVERLPVVLNFLQIPAAWIEAELAEMEDVRFDRTTSRSILGVMTDFKRMIDCVSARCGGDLSFDTMSFLLACPCKPIDYRSPGKMTHGLMEKRYGG
jgi:hypothetical protein